jgi:hypothetical protein
VLTLLCRVLLHLRQQITICIFKAAAAAAAAAAYCHLSQKSLFVARGNTPHGHGRCIWLKHCTPFHSMHASSNYQPVATVGIGTSAGASGRPVSEAEASSMSAAVWRSAWPVERLRQRAFFTFGMDVLLKLNLQVCICLLSCLVWCCSACSGSGCVVQAQHTVPEAEAAHVYMVA